jgi:hypothetical protein
MKRAALLDDESATEEDQIRVVKLRKKVVKSNLDQTYEDLFVSDPAGRTQKLMLLKRHVLQTILSIERELARRSSRDAIEAAD